MMIPPRFLDEVRNRLVLSDVIGKRIKVVRSGREFKACCPFHKEKTPSFTINDDKQFYHCFGCGAHGDVIGFVMQHDNLSFIDALELLSSEAGLQMPKPDFESVQKAKVAKDMYTLLEATTQWFMQQLYDSRNQNILSYIQERGVNSDTLLAFHVGYAPADRQSLRTYLKEQGYDDSAMMEAGLLRKSDKGEYYVFFRERVIFPVTDRRGRVVAFGGRILPDHLRIPQRGDFTPPKYINSSETPVFDKGRMLYGEAMARQAVRDGQSVIVTEGYMDVIACYQAGFKGAVAPMGTALTEDQILSLWSMISEDEKVPVLCFDGDNAGRSAASRACDRLLPLLKPGQSARFAFLPEGEDPDSLLRNQGTQAFKRIIDSSLSLFDFIWVTHIADRKFDTPEARAGVSKALKNKVATIADRDVQSHYMAILRKKISETFFKRDGFGEKAKKYLTALKPRKPVFNSVVIYEKILTATIINHPYIYESVGEQYGAFNISDKMLNRLKQAIVSVLEENVDINREDLCLYLKQKGFVQEIGDILNESVYVHAAFALPCVNSDDTNLENIVSKWLDVLNSIQERGLQNEIKQGWKDAFYHSNEDEEEKLRNIVQGTLSE